MGFNKKYLPNINDLKREAEADPGSLDRYWKADALLGPPESLEYLQEEMKKREKSKSAAEFFQESHSK